MLFEDMELSSTLENFLFFSLPLWVVLVFGTSRMGLVIELLVMSTELPEKSSALEPFPSPRFLLLLQLLISSMYSKVLLNLTDTLFFPFFFSFLRSYLNQPLICSSVLFVISDNFFSSSGLANLKEIKIYNCIVRT